MKPSKTELIAVLTDVLVGVVAITEGYLTEPALAVALGTDRRRLQALRAAGIVAPRILGRCFVYSAEEARVGAVAVALIGIGAQVAEIAALLGEGERCTACAEPGRSCGANQCCAALLDAVALRAETELAELRRFDRLLGHYADRLPGPFPLT